MTEADKVVFLNAVEQKDFEPEFTSKKWAYIVDQQSVSGTYNSQLQFNLGNLGSSSRWADIKEGIIRFPVALTITDTAVNDHSIGWDDSTNFTSNMAATIKGSFYSLINSMQFTIGNTTLQSHMPYLSSAIHFDILSTWSLSEYAKWRDALALSIDEVNTTYTGTGIAVGNTGLANVAGATACTAGAGGFTMTGTANKGFIERAYNLNNSIVATNFKRLVNPHGPVQGEGQYAAPAAAGHAASAKGVIWAATYMASVRLQDLCPAAKEMPPLKNIRGFAYIAYNSAQTTYSLSAASPALVSAPTHSSRFGNTNPMLIGTQPNVGTNAITGVVARCDVSGATITMADTTTITPAFAAARLYVPLIDATPSIDKALTLTKTIRYNDRVLTTINIASGTSLASVVSAGVVNPKRLTILPLYSAAGSSGLTIQAVPELSPFEPAPMASSPFAALSNIQILVAGTPVLQTPTLYSFETYQQEIANEFGGEGGQDDQAGSGILRQSQWEQLYRYYTYNLGRRLESQDGSAVSIQLSCTNDTACDMRLLVWVEYEREAKVDTAIGSVIQHF